MLHPPRPSGSALATWSVIVAALAFGLLEWLALARCRLQDRRLQRHTAHHRHAA